MQNVRLLWMPPCRMASSGVGMFGDDHFDRFMAWMDAQPRGLHPCDYLCSAGNGTALCWLYEYSRGVDVPAEFEVIDFSGGLYAVTTDIDQRTDMSAVREAVDAFLQAHGLMRDASRMDMGHIISAPEAAEVLGYEQMDYYVPVKKSEK